MEPSRHPFKPAGIALLAITLVVLSTLVLIGVRASTPPTARHTGARVVTMEIGGMTCAACVAKLDSTLSAVPGVARAEVRLRSQTATLVCDRQVPDSALTAAVRRAGPQYLGLIQSR